MLLVPSWSREDPVLAFAGDRRLGLDQEYDGRVLELADFTVTEQGHSELCNRYPLSGPRQRSKLCCLPHPSPQTPHPQPPTL